MGRAIVKTQLALARELYGLSLGCGFPLFTGCRFPHASEAEPKYSEKLVTVTQKEPLQVATLHSAPLIYDPSQDYNHSTFEYKMLLLQKRNIRCAKSSKVTRARTAARG